MIQRLHLFTPLSSLKLDFNEFVKQLPTLLKRWANFKVRRGHNQSHRKRYCFTHSAALPSAYVKHPTTAR